MAPPCELIGALPVVGEARLVLLGVACGSTLQAACSLVLNGAGRRLRIDLSSTETSDLVAVLGGSSSMTACSIQAVRDGAQVVLTVEGLRLRVLGVDLHRDLQRALARHVSQPAIAGAC